jgi:serine/threonine-protein kinase
VPPGYTASAWVPQNGEGRRFTDAALDATLTVWGTNAAGVRPAEKLAEVIASVEGDGGRVTFRSADKNGYTVSGFQGDGKIFYEHEAIGAGSTAGLRWVYPAAHKAELDQPVTDTVEGFEPGDLSRPH